MRRRRIRKEGGSWVTCGCFSFYHCYDTALQVEARYGKVGEGKRGSQDKVGREREVCQDKVREREVCQDKVG